MTPRAAQDLGFESRVRESFARQIVMSTLGARLLRVAAGEVEIELAHRSELVQPHGFLHAGVLATILDSACGYAALSMMPKDAAVLSVEFEINMLAPAAGERFIARARVVRAGRNLRVCQGDAVGLASGGGEAAAVMVG